MRVLLLSLFAVFVWSSCQTESAILSSEPQSVEKLYVLKCAKCHELYNPKNYSDADWDFWMAKMRKKSKLKPEQFEAISNYTQTVRAASPTPRPEN
jgi:hypothetical protein